MNKTVFKLGLLVHSGWFAYCALRAIIAPSTIFLVMWMLIALLNLSLLLVSVDSLEVVENDLVLACPRCSSIDGEHFPGCELEEVLKKVRDEKYLTNEELLDDLITAAANTALSTDDTEDKEIEELSREILRRLKESEE